VSVAEAEWSPRGRDAPDGARAQFARLGGYAVHAVAALTVAFFATALPVVASEVSKALALAVCAVTALLVANFAPKTIPMVIVVSVLFQNLFVAWVSPFIENTSDFNFVRGFNFLTIVVFFLYFWFTVLLTRERYSDAFMRYFWGSTIALLVVGAYFGYGLVKSPQGAIIYLRNIALPLMIFQICLTVAYAHRPNVTVPMIFLAVIVIGLGYFEFLLRDDWFRLTNSVSYWWLNSTDMREAGGFFRVAQIHRQVMTGLEDGFRVTLFNTALLSGLDLTVMRLNGPNFHSISFAYAVSFLALFLFACRRFVLFALLLPVLVFTSAKGALVVLVFTMTMTLASTVVQARLVLIGFTILMLLYGAFVTVSGIRTQDYHVLGLIGGIKGFLSNPIGHGLGSGGNLATNFGELDWEAAQHSGETEIAVESAVGVILFQMGIAAFVVLGFYYWVGFTVWRLFDRLRHPQYCVAGYGLFAILVNGFFQEEALFSPLSLGLMVLFAGLAIGSAARSGVLLPDGRDVRGAAAEGGGTRHGDRERGGGR
jgi:hypothetical protein